MGFTRYWGFNKKANKKEREKIIEVMSSIIDLEKEKLTGFDGDKETPIEIKKTCVSFNGIGEDSHETFCFIPSTKPDDFNFCKTANKPYDRAVCACLIAAKRILGKKIDVSSDGPGDEDLLALKMVDDILGPEPEEVKPEPEKVKPRPKITKFGKAILTLVEGGKK
jgi:hypothetical protein